MHSEDSRPTIRPSESRDQEKSVFKNRLLICLLLVGVGFAIGKYSSCDDDSKHLPLKSAATAAPAIVDYDMDESEMECPPVPECPPVKPSLPADCPPAPECPTSEKIQEETSVALARKIAQSCNIDEESEDFYKIRQKVAAGCTKLKGRSGRTLDLDLPQVDCTVTLGEGSDGRCLDPEIEQDLDFNQGSAAEAFREARYADVIYTFSCNSLRNQLSAKNYNDRDLEALIDQMEAAQEELSGASSDEVQRAAAKRFVDAFNHWKSLTGDPEKEVEESDLQSAFLEKNFGIYEQIRIFFESMEQLQY